MKNNKNNIIIDNCTFEANGTAIKGDGKLNMAVTRSNFRNNNRDIDLNVTEDSVIIVRENAFIGAIKSISINDYQTRIEDIKEYVKTFTDSYIEERKEFIAILEELKNSKNEPSKIRKLLNELKSISVGTTTGLITLYIKNKLGL